MMKTPMTSWPLRAASMAPLSAQKNVAPRSYQSKIALGKGNTPPDIAAAIAEIRAITVAAGRFYRDPPAGFADHPLLAPRGALLAGRADQEAAVRKAADEFARLVPTVRWLEPAEALRRQPLLRPEACAG